MEGRHSEGLKPQLSEGGFPAASGPGCCLVPLNPSAYGEAMQIRISRDE